MMIWGDSQRQNPPHHAHWERWPQLPGAHQGAGQTSHVQMDRNSQSLTPKRPPVRLLEVRLAQEVSALPAHSSSKAQWQVWVVCESWCSRLVFEMRSLSGET